MDIAVGQILRRNNLVRRMISFHIITLPKMGSEVIETLIL
jgi:hypothetical protein